MHKNFRRCQICARYFRMNLIHDLTNGVQNDGSRDGVDSKSIDESSIIPVGGVQFDADKLLAQFNDLCIGEGPLFKDPTPSAVIAGENGQDASSGSFRFSTRLVPRLGELDRCHSLGTTRLTGEPVLRSRLVLDSEGGHENEHH
jgi:hypothetical protein